MHKVLIVDDDPVQSRLTSEVVAKAGFTALTADSGAKALDLLRTKPGIGAMILDMVMPEMDGMAVLEALRRETIAIPVIVQTAQTSLDTVISAMRLGAVDFFVKPVAPERITISLRNALKLGTLESSLKAERARRDGSFSFAHIITRSDAMTRTMALGKKAAASNIPVLIEGESGVGKELLARAIQGSGDRAGKPFVTVNCSAIPANLVESILFGHVKGAFTGATSDAPGKFREAHNGTLFLDEVGELPLDTQVKLLRALQEGEIDPVGAKRPVRVDVRIVSATNRDLAKQVEGGAFREDLFYRLNVFPIEAPALRDRREDVPALVDHFIGRFNVEEGKRVVGCAPETAELLTAFDWPGNVRQLENAVYRAIVLADGPFLKPHDFPAISGVAMPTPELDTPTSEATPVAAYDLPPAPDTPIRILDGKGHLRTLEEIERDLIQHAIEVYAGHMSEIARRLGIGRSTLYRKVREQGLDVDMEQSA
ncbi:MAG TPA: sigma-54-dependent Fis family transcriptional regulator [Brevundimonas sp.]|nr:sigma-54-dependent Fis family transcriptional regulator [Brevundimonas sp.]